jgi:hypothetical protein
MQLTVEAFAENKKRHPMHMKIVAASRALAYSRKKSRYDQKDYPDAKHSSHGPVGG